jgi:hypothetical protein
MKSLMLLLQLVLHECGVRCGTSTDLDWKTIEVRVENEGLEFLTLTLPQFCNDFERSLALRGTVSDDSSDQPLWLGWKKRGTLPVFLGGFLDLIFDRDTGRLKEDLFLDEATSRLGRKAKETDLVNLRTDYWFHNEETVISAVASIRQITRLFSKIEIESSKERIDAAYQDFLLCENVLKAEENNFHVRADLQGSAIHGDFLDSVFFDGDHPRAGRLRDIGRLLYGDVYTVMCTDLLEGHPIPKHGPGSTADRLLGNKKFEQTAWPTRLDRSFPAGEYLLPSWRYK